MLKMEKKQQEVRQKLDVVEAMSVKLEKKESEVQALED